MNSIGPLDHLPPTYTRPASPAVAPADRPNEHGRGRDHEHDSSHHHADNQPDTGPAGAPDAANPRHALNVTV